MKFVASILSLIFLSFQSSAVYSSSSLDGCASVKGTLIKHFDIQARETGLKKRILVIGQIHGDEHQSGQLATLWLKRLSAIGTPSNYWRIIPVVNPDGTKNRTRYNANNVDLNRNFPTTDWDKIAVDHWKTKQKADKRRFPGEKAGSEVETQCVISHINDFKPDLVISIHTPYGQFDFDGPETKKISTRLLPWKRLGTFPGSLGRYLWDERKIPVLTIELKPNSLNENSQGFVKFQDLLSDLVPN